jgi:excisionase family DNA binding protein
VVLLSQRADGLLTAADVGGIFQVHPKTIYAWAERGEIPFVRLGRRAVRFRRQDVDNLVTDRLVPAGRSARNRRRAAS